MKFNTKIIALSLTMIGAVSMFYTAEAFQGDPNVKGANYSPERHEAMTKAFANNDYNAWKNLMQNTRGRATQVINANNFSKFVEAHNLALNGDITGAQKIKKELGLGLKNGHAQGRNRLNK